MHSELHCVVDSSISRCYNQLTLSHTLQTLTLTLKTKDEERKRNREGMAAADLESAFYRYYSKLQPVIMALNQQRQALKDFSTRRARTMYTVYFSDT